MQRTSFKGRGSISNRTSRFEQFERTEVIDDWADSQAQQSAPPAPRTTVHPETARTIISRNSSPDISFDRSINPYRGCEHGCIYCYARPSHAYLDHSPGLDFETILYCKTNAASVLRAEFSKASYVPRIIALGTNTDPYQPIERRLRITASLLEVFEEFNHPVAITTKSASVTRDIPVLQRLAQKNLVRVMMSVGCLDGDIARTLEPRASSPWARINAVRKLSDAGVPTGVIVAPIIPALTDPDMEKILYRAKEAGAGDAAYVLLRLPLEVAELFQEWLVQHHPLKATHVMNLVAQTRGGKVYDSRYGSRMKGTGVYAQLIEQRFKKACAKAGLNQRRHALDTALFFRPRNTSKQLSLF